MLCSGVDVKVVDGLDTVDAEAWDALAGDDNPFVEHRFLHLLETSRSACAEEGWLPTHVLVEEAGELVGAAPCYLKDHSYGEYIFDWMWADAANRAGVPYYPKLSVAVPFTPATGPRLLVHPRADRTRVREALISGLDELTRQVDAHGWHVLFCTDEEGDFLEKRGLIRRATHQFHWRNDGYEDFDQFLGALKSSARKQIRRERRKVSDAGVTVELRRGDEVDPDEWDTLFRLYMATGGRKWGTPYLRRGFFEDARHKLGPRAIVVFARRGSEIIAGTLSFQKGRHVYGRYWGCFEHVDQLHFELCYYRLIEHAIAEGLVLVEAGAQGPHKLKRGFLPVVTHSAHRLAHPQLHSAIARAMKHESRMVVGEVDESQDRGPFRDDARPRHPARAGVALSPATKPPDAAESS
jgi:predicted N-acyltransferase